MWGILRVVHFLNGSLGMIFVFKVNEAEASAPAVPHHNDLWFRVSTRRFKSARYAAELTAFSTSPNSSNFCFRAWSSVDHDRLLSRSVGAPARDVWSSTYPT